MQPLQYPIMGMREPLCFTFLEGSFSTSNLPSCRKSFVAGRFRPVLITVFGGFPEMTRILYRLLARTYHAMEVDVLGLFPADREKLSEVLP